MLTGTSAIEWAEIPDESPRVTTGGPRSVAQPFDPQSTSWRERALRLLVLLSEKERGERERGCSHTVVETGSRSRERTREGVDFEELSEDEDDNALITLLADEDGASFSRAFFASLMAAFSREIFEIVT